MVHMSCYLGVHAVFTGRCGSCLVALVLTSRYGPCLVALGVLTSRYAPCLVALRYMLC